MISLKTAIKQIQFLDISYTKYMYVARSTVKWHYAYTGNILIRISRSAQLLNQFLHIAMTAYWYYKYIPIMSKPNRYSGLIIHNLFCCIKVLSIL